MNFTFTGFVLVALFILPGAIWTGYYDGQFQTKKHTATELVIISIGFSIVVHFFLSWFLLYICTSNCFGYFGSTQISSKKLIDLQQMTTIEYIRILRFVMGYILLSSLCAYLAAKTHCAVQNRRTHDKERENVVFQNLFDKQGVNYIKVTMNDGLEISGKVKHYPQDYESVHAESRDLILTGVTYITKQDFIDLDQFADPGMETNLLIKTSDVKLMEVVRPSSDAGQTNFSVFKNIVIPLIVGSLIYAGVYVCAKYIM